MEKQKLQILINQYFKSFKRYEGTYSRMSNFDEKVKEFNNDFLNLISAVLSGDVRQIYKSLRGNLIYIHATINEQDKLDLELLGGYLTEPNR